MCHSRNRPVSRFLRALACATLLIASSGAGAQTDEAQRKAQQAQVERKLAVVRTQIAQLAAAQRATGTQRDQINATLARQAQQLNDAARALHETDAAIEAKSQALAQLQDQRSRLESRL